MGLSSRDGGQKRGSALGRPPPGSRSCYSAGSRDRVCGDRGRADTDCNVGGGEAQTAPAGRANKEGGVDVRGPQTHEIIMEGSGGGGFDTQVGMKRVSINCIL